MIKTVYVIEGAFLSSVHRIFKDRGILVIDDPRLADAIVWTGGGDVDPSAYGESNTHSYSSPELDAWEKKFYDNFPGKKRIGICRGGQLLNVWNGGSMWQDIQFHRGNHLIRDHRDNGDRMVMVSSLHHQMMRPTFDAEVLATCKITSLVRGGDQEKRRINEDYDDIEAVFYPKTRSLCYQPHPECGPKSCTDHFFDLIEAKL